MYKQKFGLYEDAIRKSDGDPAGIERPLVHHIHVCDAEDEAKHLKRNRSYELNVEEIVRGGGIVAEPGAVAEDICRLRDEYGVNHVILVPWRGPDHAVVMRSIESFANDAMPLVNAVAPVASNGNNS